MCEFTQTDNNNKIDVKKELAKRIGTGEQTAAGILSELGAGFIKMLSQIGAPELRPCGKLRTLPRAHSRRAPPAELTLQ